MEHSLRRPASIADSGFGNTLTETVEYSVHQSFFIEMNPPHHCQLRRHITSRSRQDQKVTSVVVTVVVVFFVTYLPIFAIRMVIINLFIENHI